MRSYRASRHEALRRSPIKNVGDKPRLKTSKASIPDNPLSFPPPLVIPDNPLSFPTLPYHSRHPPIIPDTPLVIPDVCNRESSNRVPVTDVPHEGPVHPLYSGHKILRLREGVGHTGRLRPETTSRVIETKADRVGTPGLEAGREEVIAAGTLILRCTMEELKAQRCLISEYG